MPSFRWDVWEGRVHTLRVPQNIRVSHYFWFLFSLFFIDGLYFSHSRHIFHLFFYGTASLSSPTAPADVAKEQELLGDDGGCVLVTPGRHTPFRSLRMRWGSLFDVSMDLLDALVGPF